MIAIQQGAGATEGLLAPTTVDAAKASKHKETALVSCNPDRDTNLKLQLTTRDRLLKLFRLAFNPKSYLDPISRANGMMGGQGCYMAKP